MNGAMHTTRCLGPDWAVRSSIGRYRGTAMMRAAGLAVLLLASWFAIAHAQVAVPSIAPAALRINNSEIPIFATATFTPENPAALQWGAPSRIGGGTMVSANSSRRFDGKAESFKGTFAGLRLVGQRISLAAEVVDFEVLFPANVPPALPPKDVEERNSSLALAFSLPEWLAYGISSEKVERTIRNRRIEVDGATLGISWRVGENLFLGAAVGKDDATRTFPLPQKSAERDTLMAGVGLRGGGDLIWHIEYSYFRRKAFKDQFGVALPGFQGFEIQQGMIEAIWWDLLLGVTAYNGKSLESLNEEEIASLTVDYGIAPLSGLTLTGRYERTEHTVGDIEFSIEQVHSAAITWQF